MNDLPSGIVLVPIDFTETSLNTLAIAASFCRQQQARLHLLYVLPPEMVDVEPSVQSKSALSDHHLVREGSSMIQMLAQITAQEQKIDCWGSCQTGLIHDEVIHEACSRNAELIIMGTHTGSDLQAFRTNNEAYQIIKMAPCPVLTVPDNHHLAAFRRILFPVRPIPDAADKYEFARKIIRQNAAELIVLALTIPDEVVSMDQVQDALSILDEKLAQDGVKSQILFCPTDEMAETVLKKTNELEADLLLITARLATTSANFFIGPFTQQVIHNARIPVLSIRPEVHPEPEASQLTWQYERKASDLTAFDG